MTTSTKNPAEAELQKVREQYGIETEEDLTNREIASVRTAWRVAQRLCSSGPMVYASALLGISRNALRRRKLKYKIGSADDE